MKAKDITNQKFGKLTALSVFYKDNKRWSHCKCDCGNLHDVSILNLGRGTNSCGCIHQERLHKRKQIDSIIKRNATIRYYKRNAKVRNLKWDISNEEFDILQSQVCYFCGKDPLNGIDRLDNNKGYILDNCVSCCTVCNRAKLAMSETEFLQWILKVSKYRRLI